MGLPLSNKAEIVYCTTGLADGTSTGVNGAEIDCSNCEGVLFIQPVTNSTAAGTVKVESHGSTASGGTYALMSVNAQGTTGAAGTVVALDLYRPTFRYIVPRAVVATANCTLEPMIAIKYGLTNCPSTQGSTSVNKLTVATTST